MTSAASPQRPSSGSRAELSDRRALGLEITFLVGCLAAGILSPPLHWQTLLVLLLACCLGLVAQRRWRILAQVSCSMGFLPIWGATATDLAHGAWILGGGSVLLIILAWPLVVERRIGLILLLLGVIEGARGALLGGALSTALGLALLGVTGAGVFAGCVAGRAVARGALLMAILLGGRLFWAASQDSASLTLRAGWGLSVDDSPHLGSEQGLVLLQTGYQSTALVDALLLTYSVDELMGAGLQPRREQLGAADYTRAARWLESRGEGGRALTLLGEALSDPQSCWWAILFSRTQEVAPPSCEAAPTASETHELRTQMVLDWPHPGQLRLQIDFHLTQAANQLRFSSRDRPVDLEISIDHGAWVALELEADRPLVLEIGLADGPHRLQARRVADKPAPERLTVSR